MKYFCVWQTHLAMITEKQYKALKIVAEASGQHQTIRAYEFALKFWGESLDKEHLFTSLSNQGEGACYGKKAWRCGGAYLGKLHKAGFLSRVGFCYYINFKGEQAIREFESRNGNNG